MRLAHLHTLTKYNQTGCIYGDFNFTVFAELRNAQKTTQTGPPSPTCILPCRCHGKVNISSKRPRKNVNLVWDKKSGFTVFAELRNAQKTTQTGPPSPTCILPCRCHGKVNISSKRPRKNVNLVWDKKSGVDPPPSPTAPTSYRQLFCSFNTSLTLWYDIS